MLREHAERILKENGWQKTISAPQHVVDWQRSNPYNRIILYPRDFTYLTNEALLELMAETNLSKHAEILLRARSSYARKL